LCRSEVDKREAVGKVRMQEGERISIKAKVVHSLSTFSCLMKK